MIATKDNKLPHLLQAVDPEWMARGFEAFFRRLYPDLGLTVSQCQVRQVYHKPGKGCSITYRLLGHDQDNRPYDQWFYARMSPGRTKQLPSRKEPPAAWPASGFWHPVCVWPEMHMLLYAFPYDPKLPYLGQLEDAGFVKRHVEANLPRLGCTRDWQCQEVTCHKVKYTPAKSCVLRYEVLMVDTGGKQRQITFYSKTYNSAKSRYVYEVLQQLCVSPACIEGRVHIPGPIAHLDEANTLWQHAWEGKKLAQLGEELGWVTLLQTTIWSNIASMLAALQQVAFSAPALQPGYTPTMVLQSAHNETADLLQFLPDRQEELTRIAATLASLAPDSPEHLPRTTIHGTFKIAQILCRDDQLAVVDFDSVACGDPLYDVAEFIASLVYLRASDGVPAAPMAECIERFLTNYQAQVPWACDRQRLAWYVVAFLLGKIHSSLKRLEATVAENTSQAFAVLDEWLRLVKGKRNALEPFTAA